MRMFESIWLHRMVYKLCPKVVFPLKKVFVEEILATLIDKTLVTYVQLASTSFFATFTFDLWMFVGVHDIFDVVVNFLSNNWELKHVTVDLFKATETNGAAMAIKCP